LTFFPARVSLAGLSFSHSKREPRQISREISNRFSILSQLDMVSLILYADIMKVVREHVLLHEQDSSISILGIVNITGHIVKSKSDHVT